MKKNWVARKRHITKTITVRPIEIPLSIPNGDISLLIVQNPEIAPTPHPGLPAGRMTKIVKQLLKEM